MPRNQYGVATAPANAAPNAAIATHPTKGSTFQSGMKSDAMRPGMMVANMPMYIAHVSRGVSSIRKLFDAKYRAARPPIDRFCYNSAQSNGLDARIQLKNRRLALLPSCGCRISRFLQ